MAVEAKVQPVEVVAPVPIPVEIKGPVPDLNAEVRLPSETTPEQDRMTAGQRNINLIWETTQSRIALYVIIGTMVINGTTILLLLALGKEMTASIAMALGFVNSMAAGVISFYFSRTNHTKVGGVGNTEGKER